MVDPTYPLFPVFAFVGFLVVLIPLPWHLEAWNSATCYYMMWTSLSCLNQFVNCVVWAHDAIDHAPAWCEISTRLTIAASVGIPAAAMCINQRLYNISRAQTVMVTRAEKRRAIVIDTAICVLFPFVVTALSYVVQGHRYNILEQLGCFPALYNTLLTYFLVNWWPLVLGTIASIYCGLSLLEFNRRRAQFNELLASKNSSLTLGRYFRLMALSMTSLVLLIPVSSYGIYLNVTAQPLGPWISWSDTHFDFGRIEQIAAVMWRINPSAVVVHELNRWLSPACAIIFFIYFGVASEARRHYREAARFLLGKCGLRSSAAIFEGWTTVVQVRSKRLRRCSSDIHVRSGSSGPTPTKPITTGEALPPYPCPACRVASKSAASSIPSFREEKRTYYTLGSSPTLPSGLSRAIARDHDDLAGEASLPSHPSLLTSDYYSPTNSSFSHDSEQSAVSLSYTDIEAAYGARIPSFVSLQVDHSSEPPTPFACHHVSL
ncbi:hypothetical protein NUW54_g2417 [Trametes sanguinea]|uniref:Uncharacterized protein n=1 Tax=Trametes sanguinea TaxID=158606 RepID=A0ACC1Q599_9APHY|nr:hypothetical protein NUW54_g2417 [Trametes sanguinea]